MAETMGRLPTRLQKMRLSGLTHFASAAGLDPKAITVEIFKKFRDHLDASLLKDPDKTYCATIDGFRAARRMVAGWPNVEISRRSREAVDPALVNVP